METVQGFKRTLLCGLRSDNKLRLKNQNIGLMIPQCSIPYTPMPPMYVKWKLIVGTTNEVLDDCSDCISLPYEEVEWSMVITLNKGVCDLGMVLRTY